MLKKPKAPSRRTLKLAALSLCFITGISGSISHQDIVASLAFDAIGKERWQAHLVAAPTGSIHSASLSRGIAPGAETLGISTASGNLVAVPGQRKGANLPMPQVNREEKEGFLMSRLHSQFLPERRNVTREFASADHRIRPFFSAARDNPRVALLRAAPLNNDEISIASGRDNTGELTVRVASVQHLTRFPQGARVASLSTQERNCLATAIYHEARGEPIRGQIAVAQVVINRVKSDFYPDTICGVVFQNQHWRNRCQFSFACDGRSNGWRDRRSWAIATDIAVKVATGEAYLTDVGQATHYHADYVNPRWNRSMNRVSRIGRHIFFRVPGWTVDG